MKQIKILKKNKSGQQGAAVLVMALVLVTISTILILFAGNYGIMMSRAVTNSSMNFQAFEAAQAGMEYGINYLQQNSAAILANPVSGYIQTYSNSSVTNVSLANGTKFSIIYSNPVASNYTLIKITSTGTNADGTATKTVTQLVQFGSVLVNVPTMPLISQGSISLGGNSQIINTYSSNTIESGSTVGLGGHASTILSTGTSSTSGNIKSDISQSVNSIGSQSESDFFASYFGQSPTTIKSSVAHYFSNSGSTNYDGQLNGLTGTSIWIDQNGGTANLNGNTTIGSAANPVLLIVNGNLDITGNVTIYGYVFIYGNSTTDFLGNLSIVGGVGTTGSISASGSIQVTYSPTTLSNLQNSSSMKYYAKVPGSWKDF